MQEYGHLVRRDIHIVLIKRHFDEQDCHRVPSLHRWTVCLERFDQRLAVKGTVVQEKKAPIIRRTGDQLRVCPEARHEPFDVYATVVTWKTLSAHRSQ